MCSGQNGCVGWYLLMVKMAYSFCIIQVNSGLFLGSKTLIYCYIIAIAIFIFFFIKTCSTDVSPLLGTYKIRDPRLETPGVNAGKHHFKEFKHCMVYLDDLRS